MDDLFNLAMIGWLIVVKDYTLNDIYKLTVFEILILRTEFDGIYRR